MFVSGLFFVTSIILSCTVDAQINGKALNIFFMISSILCFITAGVLCVITDIEEKADSNPNITRMR